MTNIVFTDIRDREALAKKAFNATYKPPRGKAPTPSSVYKDGAPSNLHDRVFRVLREAASTGNDHRNGVFLGLTDAVPPAAVAEVRLAAAMGYLLRDGVTDPLSEPSTDAIYRALAEYQKDPILHANVLELI